MGESVDHSASRLRVAESALRDEIRPSRRARTIAELTSANAIHDATTGESEFQRALASFDPRSTMRSLTIAEASK